MPKKIGHSLFKLGVVDLTRQATHTYIFHWSQMSDESSAVETTTLHDGNIVDHAKGQPIQSSKDCPAVTDLKSSD